MYWMRSGWVGTLLLMAGLLLFVRPAVAADEAGSLQVRADEQVVQCTAELGTQSKAIAMALKDGIDAATTWHIQVARVREYWLNDGIADITVIRRVEPDLLSRSWQLVDDASGISQRVYNLDDAVRFLSRLELFPVLDRSLLDSTMPYRMTVKVEVHHGEIKAAWWSSIWHPAQAIMQQDFKLQ